jgi:hypothetical protein
MTDTFAERIRQSLEDRKLERAYIISRAIRKDATADDKTRFLKLVAREMYVRLTGWGKAQDRRSDQICIERDEYGPYLHHMPVAQRMKKALERLNEIGRVR